MDKFYFTHPNSLWALAALGVVVALYLFYRRFRPQAVTGLFLWGAPRREGQGGRTVEKPFLSRAFLFDMLAAAFFAMALAGPAWRTDTGRPLAIVLDNSFAMRARGNHVQAGRLAADLLVGAERGGAGALVVLAGARPTILAGADMTAGEKGELLARYLPADTDADIDGALALLRDAYHGTLDIRVITNRPQAPAAANIPHTAHLLRGQGGNLAFGGIWRHERDGVERLIFSVVNHSSSAASADVAILSHTAAGTEPLVSEPARFDPGESRHFEYTLDRVADAAIVVRVSARDGEDVIAEDSEAFLPPPPRRTITYRLDGLGGAEPYFRLALEAAGCAPVSVSSEEATVEADLLVTRDGEASGSVLTLQLTAGDAPGVFNPPYVVDMANPLCRDVDLSVVPWVVASRDAPENAEQSYIMAGDMPLYWRSSTERLHLNLVPERCLVVHEPAWPALIANLVSEASALAPGLGKNVYRPGEALRYRGDLRKLRLLAGDAPARTTQTMREFVLPKESGLYTLRDGGGEIGDISIVPLYGDASDTTVLSNGERNVVFDGGVSNEHGEVDLVWLFLGIALAFAAGNWLRKNSNRHKEAH